MTSRRAFLRRTSLALAGGILLGDAALELFARLTHRRTMFPSAWPELHGVPWSMAPGPESLYTIDSFGEGNFTSGGRIVLYSGHGPETYGTIAKIAGRTLTVKWDRA